MTTQEQSTQVRRVPKDNRPGNRPKQAQKTPKPARAAATPNTEQRKPLPQPLRAVAYGVGFVLGTGARIAEKAWRAVRPD